MNIVIVEDSSSIRRLIERNLHEVPGAHIVGQAAGEAEAIALIREKRPDLVLLDLSLSPGKGTNVLRQVRAEGIACRIAVLTNQPLEVFRAQCLALGADAFYDKTTDIGLVVESVRAATAAASGPAARPTSPLPTSPMGLRDALTSLPTRTALLEKLDLALRIARRDGHSLAVYVVALEDLAGLQRTCGLQRSEDLIAQAGERLTGAFARSDVVARLAEDGFSVVVTRIEAEDDAARIRGQIAELMEPVFTCGSRGVRLGSGIGMALFPRDGATAQELVALADHRAREENVERRLGAATSRPASALASPDPLLHDLRAAIGTPAMTLAFQPQCTLSDGTLSGIEALARWTHPVRGPVSPAQFVQLAEENGLIEPLSSHLFDHALAARRQLVPPGQPLPVLALNVSALQVGPQLIDLWVELLDRHATRACEIELEFTETAVLSDGPEVARTLAKLRDMGFSLALDDFGVGYSSLSMLQRLPISTLKIDRSFVADIEFSSRSAAIVGSMIRLAHGLQIRVVAEGVEREQQLDILKDLGCDEIQGYLLARPLPAAAFCRWAEEHRGAPWPAARPVVLHVAR